MTFSRQTLDKKVIDLKDYLDTVVDVFKRVHGEKYITKDSKGFKLVAYNEEDTRFLIAKEDFKLIEKIQNEYLALKLMQKQN